MLQNNRGNCRLPASLANKTPRSGKCRWRRSNTCLPWVFSTDTAIREASASGTHLTSTCAKSKCRFTIPKWSQNYCQSARSNRMFEVRKRGLTLIAINHVKGLHTWIKSKAGLENYINPNHSSPSGSFNCLKFRCSFTIKHGDFQSPWLFTRSAESTHWSLQPYFLHVAWYWGRCMLLRPPHFKNLCFLNPTKIQNRFFKRADPKTTLFWFV